MAVSESCNNTGHHIFSEKVSVIVIVFAHMQLLAEGAKTIPYRESALTKLLKNALGGNRYDILWSKSTATVVYLL